MADDFYTVSGLEVKAVGDAAGNNGLHRKQYKTGTINKKKKHLRRPGIFYLHEHELVNKNELIKTDYLLLLLALPWS